MTLLLAHPGQRGPGTDPGVIALMVAARVIAGLLWFRPIRGRRAGER